MFEEENYSSIGLGPHKEEEEEEEKKEGNVVFEVPDKLSSRNTPFEIITNFNQYRSGRDYQSE